MEGVIVFILIGIMWGLYSQQKQLFTSLKDEEIAMTEEKIEYANHIVPCEECRYFDSTYGRDGIGLCKRCERTKESREFCLDGVTNKELRSFR